jgi:hypothetical protein
MDINRNNKNQLIIQKMEKYLVLILSVLTLNTSCTQSVTRNPDTKFIDFVNSFEEEKTDDVIWFAEIIEKEMPMSKEEALKFVYHTDDTTRLYCVNFDYSNESEEFRGVIGTSLSLPDKCLKIDMGDYFFIAYNSCQCINNIDDCPNPNDLRGCFLNGEFNSFLTLCIVDKGFNLRDSMLVCKDSEMDILVTGLLNPKNGKIFLYKDEDGRKVYLHKVNKTSLKFEYIKKENLSRDMSPYDLMKTLEKLGWKESFLK